VCSIAWKKRDAEKEKCNASASAIVPELESRYYALPEIILLIAHELAIARVSLPHSSDAVSIDDDSALSSTECH